MRGLVQQRPGRRRRRLQLGIDVDDADVRIVLLVAGISDEGGAQHRFGALDRTGIAATCVLHCARDRPHIVTAGIEVVGLGSGEELDELLRSRARPWRASGPRRW